MNYGRALMGSTRIGGCMYKLTIIIVSPGNTSDAAETVLVLASSPDVIYIIIF